MEDFNNLTEEEKIWYKKYIKYKTKYEELKQIGSGITISHADYKKILGIEPIWIPRNYNYFTYDYTVAYFFIKIFNDGTPTRAAIPKEINMLGGAEGNILGGGRCINSIRYFIETIEKAKIVRKNEMEGRPVEKKYKKVILNYLLQILNLKNILGDNLKNKKIIDDITDDNITDDNITDSCNLMRNRLIDYHAKFNHTKKTQNDEDSLVEIYGKNHDQSRDKVELYYGFYIGLIICILHSLDSRKMVILTEKINHSLNHFFKKVREKEKENFINYLNNNKYKKLVQNKESAINTELQNKFSLNKKLEDDNKNINQNFNKFSIPENYPEDLLDIPERDITNKDYQFLRVVYDQITA